MNTYLKIIFLGTSLSLGFSACQNDSTNNNQTEEKSVVETPELSKTAVEEPILAEKEEGETNKAITEKEPTASLINTDSIEAAEKAQIKKEKKEAARELRHKKRRAKRKAEQERKRAEKAAELEAQRETIQEEDNTNEVTNYEEPTTLNNGNARINFVETNHNYGIIQQGEEVRHKFKFKNTGTSELVISNVVVSCGCTHPSYPFIPLAPGEEGFIGVHFDSKGRLGKQKPTITVYTNAKPQTYDLHLEGYVDARSEAKEETTDSL